MNIEATKFLKYMLEDKLNSIFTHYTKFSILFPKYQEKYIIESWDMINRIINSHNLSCKLNLKSGLIEVTNKKDTIDPFIIVKAKDFLRLISRSVPIQQAAKIFDETIYCDIINISRKVKNRKNFLKRRKRLIGNKGTTIKAIEIATQCYILIQGSTVSCMGKHSNLKIVRKIVEDSMDNIHPVLHLKRLIIKKELSKEIKFKNQNWENFLPFLKEKKIKYLKLKRKKSIISSTNTIFCGKKNCYDYERKSIELNQHELGNELNHQILDSYNILNC
nr:rev-interacting protein Rip-1-like protein [Cryptomonas curvata]